jgi:outer membrane protein assembly factor BamA
VELPTDARSPITKGSGGFVGLPVVRSTPTLGFGVGAVGAFLFRVDSASPQSVIGAGGVYSDTQSWLFEVGSRVYLHGGSRNGAVGLSFFDFRYDFFGVGMADGNADRSVPIAQNGDAQMINFLGRLIGPLFVGPQYLHRGVSTTLRETGGPAEVTQLAKQTPGYNVSALGIDAVYDTRDRIEAPHHGTQAELQSMFARDWLGTDHPYNFYRGWINQYIDIPAIDAVVALRATGCSVGANAPVWELCLYGIDSDLRGYVAGRYRDRTMFTTQGEFRVGLVERLEGAFFGGVGTVASSFSAVAMDQLLPSGGFGARYLVSEIYHLNVGADVAWGKNGAAFYFRLGDAF